MLDNIVVIGAFILLLAAFIVVSYVAMVLLRQNNKLSELLASKDFHAWSASRMQMETGERPKPTIEDMMEYERKIAEQSPYNIMEKD